MADPENTVKIVITDIETKSPAGFNPQRGFFMPKPYRIHGG